MSELTNDKSITVSIAGRQYPVRVSSEEEGLVRDVVNDINVKIKDFQLRYSGKDRQDCMAMIMMTYAVELEKLQKQNRADSSSDLVDQISSKIDAALK